MSGVKLASDTLKVTPEAGDIEYNGEFFGTDSAGSRAQLGRLRLEVAKTATGTAVDFTDAPPWAVRATVMFDGLSTSGTSPIQIQLGDAGGIENTGYVSTNIAISGTIAGSGNSTTGFQIVNATAGAAANIASGVMSILNISGNSWVQHFSMSLSTALGTTGGGSKTLSALLTQIRITTVNGTDTFDAGTINILYEG